MGGTNKQIDIADDLKSATSFCSTLNDKNNELDTFCFLVDWLKDADGKHTETTRLNLAKRLLDDDMVKSDTIEVIHGTEKQSMSVETFIKVYTGEIEAKPTRTDLINSKKFKAFAYLRSFVMELCTNKKQSLGVLTNDNLVKVQNLTKKLSLKLTKYESLPTNVKKTVAEREPVLKRPDKVSEREMNLRRGPKQSTGTVANTGNEIKQLTDWGKLDNSFKYALLTINKDNMTKLKNKISELGTAVWIEPKSSTPWINLQDSEVQLGNLKEATIDNVIYYVLARPVKKMSKDQHRKLLKEINNCQGKLLSPK